MGSNILAMNLSESASCENSVEVRKKLPIYYVLFRMPTEMSKCSKYFLYRLLQKLGVKIFTSNLFSMQQTYK